MPPLPKIRTQALAELARQLRYESAEAARRQLERTEALALEVLGECGVPGSAAAARVGDKTYPLDYVIFRITGLRSEGAGEGSVLVGAALLGDLAALIERLSSAAGVTVAELAGGARGGKTGVGAGPWMGVQDLERRWGVGRKTVERERRRGLIARRARKAQDQAGRTALERLMVSERAIAAFEEAGGRTNAPAPGKRVSRLSGAESDKLVALAARCRARYGWSLARCASELGRRHKRSAATITRLLKRHDETADEPIFARRRVVRESQRARAGRAARRGASVARLAARMGRSRATGYRTVASERLRYLQGLDLEGPVGPLFERDDAEEVLLAPAVVREGLGAPAPATVGETIALAEAMGAPDAEVEAARAVGALLLRFKVRRWLEQVAEPGGRGRDRGMAEIRAAETRLLWSSRLRAELVRSQLPVALRSASERLRGRDPRTLASRGPASAAAFVKTMIGAAIDAIDRFDPFRGGRLAAATTIAVSRSVGAWASASGVELGPEGAAGRATARGDTAPVEDWTRAIDPWQARLDAQVELAAWAREAAAEPVGDERARRVVGMLYGIDGGRPRTPREVAEVLGTTAARVAAIERAMIVRLAGPSARRGGG